MRRDIPLADMAGFLALPIVAVLATYRRDGGVPSPSGTHGATAAST